MKGLILLTCVLTCVLVVEGGRDYYKILGVERGSTVGQIKRAYRAATRKYHPDKNPGDEVAAKKFSEMTAAYEVLSDKEKRAVYDRHGEEGLNNKNKRGGGMGDIFSQFFGGGGGGGGGGERVGKTIEVPLQVGLEEIYSGAVVEVVHRKQIVCPTCNGVGTERPEDVLRCGECGGQGVRVVQRQLGPGMYTRTQVTCEKCAGKGTIFRSKCSTCGGSKISIGDEPLSVRVDPGMPDGHRIDFAEQGDESPDLDIAGNVVFVLETLPHDRFVRDLNDLHTTVNISLAQALAGFELELEHLDAEKVSFSSSHVTQYGDVIKIPNKGLPFYSDSDSDNVVLDSGDLYIHLHVILPTTFDRELLKFLP